MNFHYSEILGLALPETIVVLAAFAVLLIDLISVRGQPKAIRTGVLGLFACVGCLAAIGCIVAIPVHGRILDGMLAVDPLTQMVKIILLTLTFFTLLLSLKCEFTEHVGEYFSLILFDVFLSDVNVYQPDVLFVSKENLTIITEHGIEGGPDLVVEILSPSTTKYDRGMKRKIYARTGVEELWLIDPEPQRIEVYRLQEDSETPAEVYGCKATFKSALLPDLKISAAKIFKI